MCSKAFPAIISSLLIGCLFAMPATSADDPPVTEKDLTTSSNNLKELAIAFHNYNDTYGHLPIDIVDKEGKPLLSWRVAILPFVDQVGLYELFKLDEPWDSANNKKMIETIPKIYAPVRVKAKAGETYYQVFVGEDALFGPKKKPSIPRSIPDGASITGMIFEAGDPVTWSKPGDLQFDEKKPLPKLGGLFDGECHVAMCDASVCLLKKKPDEKELKNLIMPADGNRIDFKKLEKK